MRIYTVGHSTHTLEELLALLALHSVIRLADVRRFPRSRRNPQFNLESLREAFGYAHFPALGGRRHAGADSPNGGWEVPAFRAYADHALTPEFAAGLAELEALARQHPTAVMCAEAPWWRCHRRLIADRLKARGWTVCHIGPDGALTEHALPDFAVVAPDGSVLYPPAQGSLL